MSIPALPRGFGAVPVPVFGRITSCRCRHRRSRPDLYENYSCKSNRNYTHYCDPEIEKMIDQQSMEPDQAKRKKLVWEIDSKLQQAVARPIEFYLRKATCWRPEVKGLNVMVNSSYNGWRFEDVWLDK